ncbi:MAG: hypothetical protein WA012_15480 [Rhodoferax sp.]
MITVPVVYPLEIGFATLGGWLVFDHVPDLFARIGIGIIAASGAGNTLLSWRRGRGRGVCPGQFTKTCKQTEKINGWAWTRRLICSGGLTRHLLLQNETNRLTFRCAGDQMLLPCGNALCSRRSTMGKFFVLLGSLIISTSALAFHCPADMKKIDATLAANPKTRPEQLSEVKKLRAEGETLHKAGKHQESVDTLDKAMKILAI